MKIFRITILMLAFALLCSACSAPRKTKAEIAPAGAAVEVSQTTEELILSPSPSPVSVAPTPIDTASIVPLSAAVIYSVNTDGVLLYTDATRTVVLRTLAKGEQITVTAASDRYALTSEGGYVNLMLLTAIGPVVVEPLPEETQATETTAVATPTPKPKTATPTPKPTTQTTQTTTAATTTAATAVPTTGYTENCENIRNLIIADLQERGLWYPDAKVIGWDWAAGTVGYTDAAWAEWYVQGKFGFPECNYGCTSVTVTIWVNPDDGLTYLRIDTTACALPTPTPTA